MIPKFANLLLTLAVFFLPWQTQWIFGGATIAGEPSAYGVFGLYVVEAMIVAAFVLRGRPRCAPEIRPARQVLYLFLAVAFFSLELSAFSSVGRFFLLHVVSAAAFFVLLIDERTALKPLVTAFLAGLAIPVAIGWLQVMTGGSPDSTVLGMAAKDAQIAGVSVVETGAGRMLRAYGTFPHPNIFGGYVAVGVLMLAWLARFVRSRRGILLSLLAAALLASTLVITFSRSAWLAIVLALLAMVFLMRRERRLPPKRVIPMIILGSISLLATIAVFHTQVFARFNPSLRLEAISINERQTQYQTFSSVFLSAPILGVGPGAYTFALASRDPGQPVWSYQPIHSVFLLILSELGVIGFAFLAFWIWQMGKLLWMNVRVPDGMLAVSLGIVLLVIALLDHYFWSVWPGLALSALSLGVMVRLARTG